MSDKYIAFYACECEFETFETFEEAKKWLRENDYEGISEEAMEGGDFIAKITHRSKYTETDRKEDYHEHTDACPEDCTEEEWPFDDAWDVVGKVEMVEVEE
jgi:viroplasmin and RNaseH domain-containing protein